jgi:hypothetical protein
MQLLKQVMSLKETLMNYFQHSKKKRKLTPLKKEKILKSLILTYIQNWRVNSATTILTGPAFLLAFFFASCEEPIEVESDLVPGGNNTEIRYVEIPLEMNHTAYDSLLVSTNVIEGARGQIFVGHQNSPEIGDFSAQAYFGVLLSGNVIRDSIKINSEVIETKLHLGLNYYHGDNFDAPQQFRLYQLEDTLQTSGQKSDFDLESQNIQEVGEHFYTIYDEISTGQQISIDGIATSINPTDTIADFIPLENTFGNELLNLVRNQSNNSRDIYNILKGFKLEVDPGQNNLQALSLASGEAYIEVVYQSPSADTLQSIIFNLSASSFTHVDFQPGNLIPNSYYQGNSFELTDPNKAYFNNLIGISPKISLDAYLSFIDTVDYMQINKAEITIEKQGFIEINTRSQQTRPAQNIVPYIQGEGGSFLKKARDFWAIQSNFSSNGAVNNQNAGASPLNLAYDDSKKAIRGDLSFFLQEIYSDPSFWGDENNFIFTGQFIRINNDGFLDTPYINVGNFDNFLVDKENIKLKIYYTTFK